MTKEEKENLLDIANDFCQVQDRAFTEPLYMRTSRDYVYIFSALKVQINFVKWVEIKFRIYFNPKAENPRRNIMIKFPLDIPTRHYIYKYKLRDYLQGIFREKINK